MEMTDRSDAGVIGSAAGPAPRRVHVLLVAGLVLLAASIYLLSANGRGHSSDGAQYYYTADSFLRGRLNIDEDGERIGGRRSENGHYYSKAGPGQSILEFPALAALRVFLHFRDASV